MPKKTRKATYNKQFTVREAKFIEGIKQGLSQTKAAQYAGYNKSSAPKFGMLLMRRPHIRKALGIMLDQVGVTFSKIAQVVVEGLEAEKTVYIGRGENMKQITVTDHGTRLKAAALALKLLDYEAELKDIFSTEGRTLPETKPVKNNNDEPLPINIKRNKLVNVDEAELIKIAFPVEAQELVGDPVP